MSIQSAYTIERIAAETGKSAKYIRDLIRNSHLPAKKLGQTHLVLAADFEAFLEALPDA